MRRKHDSLPFAFIVTSQRHRICSRLMPVTDNCTKARSLTDFALKRETFFVFLLLLQSMTYYYCCYYYYYYYSFANKTQATGPAEVLLKNGWCFFIYLSDESLPVLRLRLLSLTTLNFHWDTCMALCFVSAVHLFTLLVFLVSLLLLVCYFRMIFYFLFLNI